MLNFALTDEQEALKALVREFAEKEIDPIAGHHARTGEFPIEVVKKMGQLGLFGLPFSEEYGGMGGDYLSLCLAIEEIGRVDQSMGITLEAGVGLGAAPLHDFGTEEQKQRWLPELCAGQKLGGFGLTEAGGGTDNWGTAKTRAVLDGDEWVINGSKQFITNAGTDMTSIVTITAWTGEKEMTSIIVPAGTPGFTVAPAYQKVGWHFSDTRELIFQDCRVPVENVLGARGAGLKQFLATLDDGRIAISALAVGLMQGCVDECVRYANEREAFGKPIGQHQAIAFKIADMEVAAQTARLMYFNAAWRKQEGLSYKREASIAKLYSSEKAVDVARQASQVFGGYGFTTEYRVGRFYQDAKILEVGEGTSEIQRTIIARDLGV
ncbi:MAG: short/branched chain acyl-CoA dehydrogenase [Nitriliruptoraceae bacterium]|jgi:short/branched chain acyl-CoA dehydrogenase